MEINLFLKYIIFASICSFFYNIYDVSVYEYTPSKMETYWQEGNNVLVDFCLISLNLSLENSNNNDNQADIVFGETYFQIKLYWKIVIITIIKLTLYSERLILSFSNLFIFKLNYTST